MSPKEVGRVGRWGIFVRVVNGDGEAWVCELMICHGDPHHHTGYHFHKGGRYTFAVQQTRFLFWKSRTVSDAIMLATNEALERHAQDLSDRNALTVAEEIATEIGVLVRDRLEVEQLVAPEGNE